jgi:hypothetical protein
MARRRATFPIPDPIGERDAGRAQITDLWDLKSGMAFEGKKFLSVRNEYEYDCTNKRLFAPERSSRGYDSGASIGSWRSRTVSHAPAAPQTAMSAMPNSEVASGTCENMSQPPNIANAICAYR